MKRRNSRSLLPSTSVKLSVFQVITVVNRSPAGGVAGAPEIGHDRLPGLVPGELAGRHVGRRRADVGAEREQAVEAAEEVDVPRLALRDRELREHRIRVDEHASRDARVFVAPEPGAAGQVDEEIGVGAERAHGLARRAVIAAVVVDEAPAVAEAERRERVVDVARAVRRDRASARSARGRRCTRRCPRCRRPRGRAPAARAGTSGSTTSRRRTGSGR